MALASVKQIKGGTELLARIAELEAQVKVLQEIILKYHPEEGNNLQTENHNAI